MAVYRRVARHGILGDSYGIRSTYVATESSLLGTGGITEGILGSKGATKHASVSEGGEGGE